MRCTGVGSDIACINGRCRGSAERWTLCSRVSGLRSTSADAFWHCCPQHRSAPRANDAWWATKLARNVERDLETETELQRQGWIVVVVWDHEDPEAAADRVTGCYWQPVLRA